MICFFLTDNADVIHMSSLVLYISYHVELSFRTLSTQMHIVNAICMLSAHVHIICLSSLTLLAYPIIHNLLYTHCLHTRTLSMSSAYCLQMHIWCTSHFYCCYLHMYMLSAYYLRICILCTHYLQWSLIYSFLTDNADVIHMSSLVLFIYPIMYNLVSAHCLHRCTNFHVICMLSTHVHIICCHLYHSSYTLLSTT